MKYRSIAVDGPAGAGKSTLAKALARALGFLYVDTGAIYRTVGLAALERGLDPADGAAVSELLPGLSITMGYGEDGLQHMFLDGADVTEAIRHNEVSAAASKAAAIPAVRDFLLEMQRRAAEEHDVIMDGRDIGTVVLPGAERRCRELRERGQAAEFDQVLAEVVERDRRDSQREAAPLRQAEDAVVADTTSLDLEGSFKLLLGLARKHLGLTEGEVHE